MMEFCVVGVFPPPSTGQSIAFKNFADEFLGEYEEVDVSGGGGGFYKLKKTIRYLTAIKLIVSNNKCVYYTLNSGGGLYLDLLFVSICKLFKRSMIIHHHSYGYINSKDWRVGMISSVLNKYDYFVFLSSRMKSDYNIVYPHSAKAVCLNNIFQYDLANKSRILGAAGSCVIKVGYLSNLTLDKGFDTICDIIRRATGVEGMYIEFHIAGPFADSESKALFDSLTDAERALVEYHGPVYGEDKDKFFCNIDLFLFPTRYENEAQPMVLVEALQYGVPVLAADRGTIKDLIGDDFTVGATENFSERALERINEMSSSKTLRLQASQTASTHFADLKKRSSNEIEDIRRMVGEVTSRVS